MSIFDDFGWEEMAMAGSLSEEMAEEYRQQRELEREAEKFWEDDSSSGNGDEGYSAIGRGPRVKRPFEQYVDDHIFGRKRLGDPMLGPSRKIGGEAANRSIILGVSVYNAHLVSEKFLEFVFMGLKATPGHAVQAIHFDPDGGPKVGGRAVFGIFDAGARTIHINLQKHLDNAIRLAECRASCFSIRRTLWYSMQTTLLHEIKHALDTARGSAILNLNKSEQDRIATEWADEVLTVLATNYDVEPVDLSEEPFFGPKIIHHIDRAIESGNWIWAKNQKKMLEKGIHYQDPFFTINSEKEYYTLSAAGLRGDKLGQKLNALVSLGMDLLNQEWDRVEMNEYLLREAIDTGTKVRIEYLAAEGVTETHVVLPTAMIKRGPFPWIETRCEPGRQPAAFRVDKVRDISLP